MTHALERNLRALAVHDPSLVERLRTAVESSHLLVRTARTGERVPLFDNNGRLVALHSLFDPVKEAARLREALLSRWNGVGSPRDQRSYLFFEGLGGGFQVRAFIESHNLAHGLIVESDLSLLKSLFCQIDLSDILSNPRIRLLLDPDPEEVASYIRTAYLPAIMGGFRSVPLRARIQMSPSLFATFRKAVRSAIDEVANDHTVQSSFGRIWTRNILTNLPRIFDSEHPLPHVEHAIVTGAGPSLEDAMAQLKHVRKGRYLIATDTSLPVLLSADQEPDAVLSIDCQNIGYRHFLSGVPPATSLFAELSVPPTVLRLSKRVIGVSGGHPLSLLAAHTLGGVPVIDTSGGNVGHAAVSLAIGLGAKSIYLFGTDFSYPLGKTYSRGSYLYDYFREREGRTAPLEGSFSNLLYHNTTLRRESTSAGFRYTTGTLTAYRDRFERVFSPYADIIRIIPGPGLPIRLSRGPGLIPRLPGGLHRNPLGAQPTARRIREFLLRYREAVAGLPDEIPEQATPSHSDSDTFFSNRQTFVTLYPLIARMSRDSLKPVSIKILFADARRVVLSFLDRAIP